MNKQERQQYRKACILELREIIDASYDELSTWLTEERLERNAKKVDKYYRYRDLKYYLRITDMNEDGHLSGWAFENLDNAVSIWLQTPYKDLSDNYEEIIPGQFWTEWQKIKSGLDNLTEES